MKGEVKRNGGERPRDASGARLRQPDMFGARPIAAVDQPTVGRVRAIGAWLASDAQRRPVRRSAASLHLGGITSGTALTPGSTGDLT